MKNIRISDDLRVRYDTVSREVKVGADNCGSFEY